MKRITMILAAGALPALASAQNYLIQDLGTLAGQSEAFAIDGTGRALGSSTQASAHFRAAAFDGTATALPELFGFSEHYAFGADAQGNIYGTSYTLGGMTVGAFKITDGVAAGLGSFAARSVNATGDVAGTTFASVSGMTLPRACFFQGSTLTSLPTLGGLVGTGMAVDELHRVAGSSSTASEASIRPCLWVGGVPRDLGTLGGVNGQAAAIRGSVVVGHSQNAAGLRRATMWLVDSAGNVLSTADLGALGAASSFALGVNQYADAVGTSGFHAVLWRGGQTIDLNTVASGSDGWTLEKAWAIGDDGVIVGTGSLLGFPRAFKLIPCNLLCYADFDCNGFVNGADFDAFVWLFYLGDPGADVDHNGFVNGDDFDSFTAAFEAGC